MGSRGTVIRFPGAPSPARPPAARPGLLEEVCRCRDQGEALVVRALLESEGIPVTLRGRVVHAIHPFSVGDLGEVIVLVPRTDAVRARGRLRRAPPRRLTTGA
jgi:hypothetical protein